MSKVKELKQQYREAIKANKGVHYCDLLAARFAENPAAFDHPDILNGITNQGKIDANEYMFLIKNPPPEFIGYEPYFEEDRNPEFQTYVERLKEFSEKFGSSEVRVIKHYTDLLIEERNQERTAGIKQVDKQFKKQADEFKKNLLDVNSDLYADCVKQYKKDFNSNLNEIEPWFKKALCKRRGLIPVPVRDEAYENSVGNGFTPADAVEKSVFNSLIELFQLKHISSGYKGDLETLEVFKSENLDISGSPTWKPVK